MNLIIAGDKSRYQFFRTIIDDCYVRTSELFFTENMGERTVFLTSVKQSAKDNVYYSAKVPLNTTVCFPNEFDLSEIEYGSSDRLVLFDEFPYCTDEDISRLDSFMKEGKIGQIEVVLYKNNRKALASDISTEEMALEEARARYLEKNVAATIYCAEDKPDFLFWCNDMMQLSGWKHFAPLIHEAKRKIETFDSCYELEYELSLEEKIDNPSSLDMFFKFDTRLMGKNVWDVYYRKAYEYCWKNNRICDEFYLNLYRKCIADICIWDLERDSKQLMRKVRKQFLRYFKGYKHLEFEDSEENYALFYNENLSSIINFRTKIITFFKSELRELVKCRIVRDIERMENLLNEYSN